MLTPPLFVELYEMRPEENQNLQISYCLGANCTNIIYTKSSTLSSRKILLRLPGNFKIINTINPVVAESSIELKEAYT